jgi:hypothetical protein
LRVIEFRFQPIAANSVAPGGACVLNSFEDISAFILDRVNLALRARVHWLAVHRDLIQARFGARRAEVHKAMRQALLVEGWLTP